MNKPTEYTTDYLVVGLGAMGSAALYHLARWGAVVTGIEQFVVDHAFGSSHGHSRVFRTFYDDPFYTSLAEAALPLWRELEARSDVSLLTLGGTLLFGQEGNIKIARSIQVMEQLQIPHELMTPATVAARFPALRLPRGSLACHLPRAGFLDASRAVRTQVAQAQRLGATVHEQVTVQEIDLSGEQPLVVTSAGRYRCQRLVVTAGPWAMHGLRSLGLPALAEQVRVTRQQKFTFLPSRPELVRPDRLPVYGDYESGLYGFPLYGPGVKVADDTLGESTDPVAVDRTLDLATRDRLQHWLAALMPQIDFTYLSGSTCMYTLTPDRDFLVGPHPRHANTIIGAGFSGHGFKFSTLVGKLLAELALGIPPSHPIARFRLER
jgi:sarcosine oxidase